jgi:hypothetical protein
MRVYVVGADGHVSSCVGVLFFLVFCGGLTGRFLICCSLSVNFLALWNSIMLLFVVCCCGVT